MTPTPQELRREEHGTLDSGNAAADRIVISGISGLFPNMRSVEELKATLYNKKNPLNKKTRWEGDIPECSKYSGCIPDIEYFDAQFFKVFHAMAQYMDPMSRKLLEQTYQAIYDAGVTPEQLNGRAVGVYVGACLSEQEKFVFYNAGQLSGLGVVGCCKAMFANRVSYGFNLKGPSIAIDDSDASSYTVLEQACLHMASGVVEAAIVGGASLTLHPQTLVHYGRQTPMCMDGKIKSFDKNADGSLRTEAVNVIFLQKAKDAKRIYAEVIGVKSEYRHLATTEMGPRYGFYRDPIDMTHFLEQFYKNINVPPQAIKYVEACGSADPEADKAELESLENVFCKDRKDPLLVGSVTSNIGCCEAAQGVTAITKVCLGYHTGKIAANLNCNNPRDDIQALRDGRMEIVTNNRAFDRSYVAINGISMNGSNSHVVLKGFNKPKDPNRYKSSIPRLVTISARQEKSVRKVLDGFEIRPMDPEEIALLHGFHCHQIYGHLGRGYTILDTDAEGFTESLSKKVSYFNEESHPLWFMYSGMGSQWAGMGTELLRIPVFAAAIEKCHKALQPKGIDIVHIITSPDKEIFNNILHSFVGIAAIQIGLTDVLKSVGIVPDMIIGHSVGELGCAYADGCFTAEEMILSAYSRGLVSVQTPVIKGSMAAVGLGFQQILKMLPPEIEVACHNSAESSTISGPADKMKQFVRELTEKGIFAKEVPCSNIAYHSRYIADAGPGLLKYLQEVITNPKPRSERWVSTSVPQKMWNHPSAKLSSAEYHTNNLLNPVLFEETALLIPANAVVVEIAPHGLLQAIVKRSLPSCKHIPLTRRGHKDNAFMVLDAIGKLYMEGFNPKISELYPKVEFPVSTGTPMLSHLVEWVQNEKWLVCVYSPSKRREASACNFSVSLYDEEHMSMMGHTIQDEILYPFAAALVAAWDTIAMSMHKTKREFSVEFSDLHLYTQPKVLKQKPLKIQVMLTRANGRFEVLNENSLIMSGYIVPLEHDISSRPFSIAEKQESLDVTSDDIYQMFYERGYNYQGDFRSLLRTNTSLNEAKIIWNNDWMTFLDGVFQVLNLRRQCNHVSQPYEIRKMCIDIKFHQATDESFEGMIVRTANICSLSSAVRCGGVLLEDIKLRDLAYVENESIMLKPVHIPNLKIKPQSSDKPTLAQGATLQIGKVGDLDTLQWVTMVEPTGPGIEVKVHYAAINDIDVKTATGVIPFKPTIVTESSFGMDFSGVSKNGKRVMGVIPHGSASERVKAIPEATWPVPDHWSLEDAATVPSAYMLAFYCLVFKAEFEPGSKILVHGGAGALGQAVISIALAHKAEVFATVSDVRKKRFLLNLFPELKEDHIGNSRNDCFVDMVKSKTVDGVNVIVSCVKGELKEISMMCGARSAILVDLVQIPTRETYSFGMKHMNLCRNYTMVDFYSVFTNEKRRDLKVLQELVCVGIKKGYVRPLSRVTYAPEEAPRAFRLLAASQHRGRVLLKLTDAETPAQSRFVCTPEMTQVVICNEDSLGLQWTDRLITKGARNVLLHCTSVPAYLLLKVKSWQKLGVNVKICSEDLSTVKGVTVFLDESKQLGPVEGIYMIATNRQLDLSHLNNIVVNLDSVARKLPSEPKHFAVLNAGRSIGQNTCVSRINSGLPATLLDISGNKNVDINATGKHGILSLRGVSVAFENALLSSYPILVANSQDMPHPTLLQQIAQISELNISENTDANISLKDLGLNTEKLPMLVRFLSDWHHINLLDEQVANLTVERIKEIDDRLHEPKLEEKRGLEIFFSSASDDEMSATAVSIFMPTLTNTAEGHDNHFQNDQTYMCVVPGLEGQHERFRDFCQQLKLPAMVVQPGLDRPKETLQQRAQRFTKTLLHKTTIVNNKFYLMGYETGVIVALEMAAILEQKGMIGTVFCVGGTPEEILSTLENHTSQYDTKELQAKMGRHMCSVIAGKDFDLGQIEEAKEGESWFVPWTRALVGKVPHSTQYSRLLIEGAYEMLSSARSYVSSLKPLKSRLVLIRASDVGLGTPPNVLMQRYSEQKVEVATLSTPLAHIMKDVRTSAIVNRNLEPETLEAYNKMNLCESYSDTTAMLRNRSLEVEE